ncbi:hypothetical protein P3T32_005066 [Ralstonia sp. GP73]|jgi:hypothetical protein|uniref:ATP-binding protein n=2 Tax=Pseudomonadota TaxID=1224 RepID=UPI0003865A0F|nr:MULTISPECIES: ATP-binding protein [Ralstonia]EPX94470.1 hypothetical protein C404_28635 [Ralstonia sp. AU12-08]MBA4202886.1 ATP-binding protein [Ralstonia sp.]MBA4233469.1 ATP-binding protein [Ralstonia sp.]MBA4238070.1 ATP-binding protein [Ralstonia sp.]MBA4280348.1 ATP-binding protein [Ralstonia sp.]
MNPDNQQPDPQGNLVPLEDAIVWTPVIERLGKTVAGWLRMDSPGAMVSGKPRLGKSAACRYLAQTLPSIIAAPVAVVIWSIPDNRAMRERDFIQERMLQSGCVAVAHRDIAVLRSRLYDRLAHLAAEASSKRVVIIIDEAQHLSADHYGYLIHCANELLDRRVRPFFLLVGQPELEDMARRWNENMLQQVHGRFHTHEFIFTGIARSELAEVLAQMDERLSPERPSPPEALLPAAYAEGWRLSELAPQIGQALLAIATQHHITGEILVPMQYLRSTVLAFFSRVVVQRLDPRAASAALMLNCLRDSGFMSVIGYYAEAAHPQDDAGGAS